LQKEFVVSGYADLATMGKLTEPVVEIKDGSSVLGKHREIARMDEQIAVGHIDISVEFMGIRDRHDGEVRRLICL